MSRVCVIRCHYYRDSRVLREVEALLESGHEVDVVCLRAHGEPRLERRGRLTIRRLPLRHAAGATARRLLFEYAMFFLMASLVVTAAHFRRRYAVVQVNSVPDVLVFTALFPRLTGARVLLDLQEPMPEFFQTRFDVDRSNPVVRLIASAEQLSIRFADAVITVTEQMRRTFVARGAPPDKVTVVMDGTDERIFDPARFSRRRDRAGFVLISHGSIEPQYGLDTVIEAVALLAVDIPGLELRIVGHGSQRAELQRLAHRLELDGLVSFSEGFVPTDELVQALADADAGVVAMKRDEFRDLTLASKMFDFIAMRTPMVVSQTRSVQETFGDGCFEYFASGDPHDLARAIRRLYRNPPLAAAYAARAAERIGPFSWAVQRQRYRNTVEGLVPCQ